MDSIDLDILYALSGDIEVSLEPFKAIAERLAISEEEVISRIRKMTEKGMIKRIAPILYHHKAQFEYNALTMWVIAADEIEAVAEYLVSFPHISHVYERASSEAWPYTLYGMIHAKKASEIDEIVEQILSKTGDVPYKLVYTVKEWKKTSPDLKYLLSSETVLEGE